MTAKPGSNGPPDASAEAAPAGRPASEATTPLARETERQAAELHALRRMLTVSRKTFSLSLAVCNSPALRDHVIATLSESVPGVKVIAIPPETVDVFGHVRGALTPGSVAALCVVGLEESVPSEAQAHPALRSLNASRELWKKELAVPVIFWLPEYAATLLAVHGRDFWRWFSHHFEFVSEQARLEAGVADQYAGDTSAAAQLDVDQKRFRIAELEERIEHGGPEPDAQLAGHVLLWLNELAFLHRFLGELDAAEESLRRALQISQNLGALEDMGASYGNLGLVYRARGDLDEAERMLHRALELEQQLGLLDGVAAVYGNLGGIYAARSDLTEAERLHLKALEIYERLGRLEGMATQYGNLGGIYHAKGNLGEAERMLRKALEIDEKLGRLDAMARHYANLGIIHQMHGDLDAAEQTLCKALEINEKLGRLEGMASDYGNLGLVYQTRGDLDEAERMHRKALAIDEKLGRLEGMANAYGTLGLV